MAGDPELTPMMAQYRRIKAELPKDALLLFRLGDFYEMFFQLALEALEQGKGIRGGAGETGEHLAVIEAANLLRIAFHHGVAEGHLAVAAHDDFAVATY
jgi:hypothetical protein